MLLPILLYPSILYFSLQSANVVAIKDEGYLFAAILGLTVASGCFMTSFSDQQNGGWNRYLYSLPCHPITIILAERSAQWLLTELSIIILVVSAYIGFSPILNLMTLVLLNVVLLIASSPFFFLAVVLRARFGAGAFRVIARILPMLFLLNLVLAHVKGGSSLPSEITRWSPFNSILQLGWSVVGGFPPSAQSIFPLLYLWFLVALLSGEGVWRHTKAN
ncbi:MAG: hypothetical protein M1492_10065 [Gammaproteobacteria bacterium]|nr:hypothetical protein [Gammaproteobacteria bacterium]